MSILEKSIECTYVLDGLEDIILHAAGFNSTGKTKRLLHRIHYVFSNSYKDRMNKEQLENLGIMTFNGLEPIGTLTGDGIFTALGISARRSKRKCCFTCSHREWVAGEDEQGYCCNGRNYKNRDEETRHLKQLESSKYMYATKKCWYSTHGE